MSITIRFLSLFLLIFSSFSIVAQEKNYQYRLDGTYPAVLPGTLSARNVRFTLSWNEKDQTIQGLCSDNFFSISSPVSGTTSISDRVFNVRFPRIIQGVSNLSITSDGGPVVNGARPAMVFMRDLVSTTLAQTNIIAVTTVSSDEVPPATACDVGFGVLSGYCGIYRGRINELSDSGNRCNLPDYNFGLQFNTDKKINLYFYYNDTTVGIPNHTLGTFLNAPLTSGISMNNRYCGVLVGTSFDPDSCKMLSLNGTFSEVGGLRNFRGRYMITEEVSGENCSYDVNVQRELGY